MLLPQKLRIWFLKALGEFHAGQQRIHNGLVSVPVSTVWIHRSEKGHGKVSKAMGILQSKTQATLEPGTMATTLSGLHQKQVLRSRWHCKPALTMPTQPVRVRNLKYESFLLGLYHSCLDTELKSFYLSHLVRLVCKYSPQGKTFVYSNLLFQCRNLTCNPFPLPFISCVPSIFRPANWQLPPS